MDIASIGPGIHPGLSNDAHHAHPAIGSSGLKLLQQSPLHYWTAYLKPDRERQEPTPAMKIGTAWHCAVFEPEAFEQRYATGHDASPSSKRAQLLASVLAGSVSLEQLVELPEGLSGTSKEGKALIAEIEADGRIPVAKADMAFVLEWHPKLLGREVLAIDTMDRIKVMAAAARAHPISRVIHETCREHVITEASMFWVDGDTGQLCKIRPDLAVMPCPMFPNGLIVDGKSGEDASPEGFAKSAWNWDMHIQASFYADGFQAALGTREPPTFLWLAQERDAPFATAYYSAADDFIRFGRGRYRRLLRIYAECVRTGQWPGYPGTVQPLQLPAWAQKIVDEEVAA